MKKLAALLVLPLCAFASTEEKIDRVLSCQPGGTLRVDVGFGSIQVVGEPSRTEVGVYVWRRTTRRSQSAEEEYLRTNPVEIVQDGNNVTVRAKTKSNFSWNWFGLWSNRNEANYMIKVPEHFLAQLNTSGGSIEVTLLDGSVKADTSGGSLKFTTIHGNLRGDTSGGSITVNECEGDINVDTSGGGIHVSGGKGTFKGDTSGGGISVKDFGGPISVDTSGGSISIENVRGRVVGSTSGGSVRGVFPEPLTDSVDLSTSGGSVTVKIAANAAFNLDAETSGGSVNTDLPVTVQGKVERSELHGTVNGGGPRLKLRSSGGSIHVQKL
ncbi:MAG: DUF4097 family beta strand repeat-containing protein [Nibricoccus sp.]